MVAALMAAVAGVPLSAVSAVRGGEVERDPVDMHARKLAQPDVAVAHQGERRQEVLAELAVGNPGFALFVFFKA